MDLISAPQSPAVGEDIRNYFASLSPTEKAAALWALSRECVPAEYEGHFVKPGQPGYEAAKLFELEGLMNAQSLGFMVEMVPLLYPHLEPLKGQSFLETLDVGARTAAGSALLADLFMAFFSRAPLAVDTIDIDGRLRDYQRSRWWNLRSVITGNIFDLPAKSYDIVVCSHTLEHIDDPAPFCRRLQEVARKFVAFYCPHNEQDCPQDHRTVSDALIDSLRPIDKHVLDSWWYRKDAGVREPCVFFVLPPL
jgi:SAM-dependent methyltransferase